MRRNFPEAPIVAVGAVVIEADEVLLVRRGQEPLQGEWSIPGGALELGETLDAGLEREINEETGIEIRVLGLIEVVDKIVFAEALDAAGPPTSASERGRVLFHYVIVDYLCVRAGGDLRSGTDALEARWVSRQDLRSYRLSPVTLSVIERAFAMAAEESAVPGGFSIKHL